MSNEQETSPNYKWFALLLLWVAFFLQQVRLDRRKIKLRLHVKPLSFCVHPFGGT